MIRESTIARWFFDDYWYDGEVINMMVKVANDNDKVAYLIYAMPSCISSPVEMVINKGGRPSVIFIDT